MSTRARCGALPSRSSPTSLLLHSEDRNDRTRGVHAAPTRIAASTITAVRTTGPSSTQVPGFKELFLGNSPKPRLSIGIGVNWVSPFGPLRLDLAKALLKQKGDDTKLFQFNVGTSF